MSAIQQKHLHDFSCMELSSDHVAPVVHDVVSNSSHCFYLDSYDDHESHHGFQELQLFQLFADW
jgi:hypothetical protein